MTVADNTSRNQYTATSGQTVFAYTFEIVDKNHIVVLKNGVALSEGTDYSVSNVGNDNGGNITLTVGATTGDVLTLYRDMPYSRTQNYTNSGDFLASEVNSDFDELWLAGEQTDRAFSQSIRKPITDSDSISMELPVAADRANKFVKFDANGAVDVASSTPTVTADAVTITDTGNYYTSNDVEGALQEVGADLTANTAKLAGIEAGADVTDTANVTAAGALMDSEVTNLDQVKAFDQTDYATAAQGTTADAALPRAGGAMTGPITTNSTFDGRDVATDGTKLDGIEAGADVTDTANVTAAGAVMDSELTNETAVKALNQGVATTDSPSFAGATISSISYPTTDGTNGQALTTDGSGSLSFTTVGASLTDVSVDSFTGTGAQTAFTLSGDPGSENNLQVYVDGVYQNKDTFTVVSTTLTFSEAPPFDALIEACTFNEVGSIIVPADGSVNSAKLANGSVTESKIASGAVTSSKLGGNLVTPGNLDITGTMTANGATISSLSYPTADGSNGQVLTTDGSGTLTFSSAGASLTDVSVDSFTGTGTQTVFTLSVDPGSENNLQVYVQGVYQNKDTFSISGTTLTFSQAPPLNSEIEACTINETGTINVPADASVTSAKLSGNLTTPGNLDVTGSVTADGLTVNSGGDQEVYFGDNTDGIALSNTGVLAKVEFGNSQGTGGVAYFEYSRSNGSTVFAQGTNGSETTRMKLANGGDISFYNSAGNSQNFFWDASSSRLGLGTTAPISHLEIEGVDRTLRLTDTGSNSSLIKLETDNFNPEILVQRQGANPSYVKLVAFGNEARVEMNNLAGKISKIITDGGGSMEFETDSVRRMNILSSGDILSYADNGTTEGMRWDASTSRLGIGTPTPDQDLHIYGGGNTIFKMEHFQNGTSRTYFSSTTDGDWGAINATNTSGARTIGITPNSGTGDTRYGGLLLGQNEATIGGVFDTDYGLNVYGNVGINNLNPQATLHVNGDSAYSEAAIFQNDGSAISWARADWINDQADGSGIVYRDQGGSFYFRNNVNTGTAKNTYIIAGGSVAGNIVFSKDATSGGAGEVARFTSDGRFLIGRSAAAVNETGLRLEDVGGNHAQILISKTDTGGKIAIGNYHNGTYVGGVNYSDTTTSFPTSSDQRLKDNIVDAPSASDDIDAIQVRSFDWKADGSHQKYGMIAQELQSVAPEAVTEGDTETDMMGVDYSKLVPMLVKEIQSLRARVAQLEND